MYHASFIVSLIVFSLTARVSCWGDVGHRTIAYLAQKYLTDSAATFLDGILANDNGDDISDAATWPDRVRRLRPYTAPWHFIDARDTPPDTCGLVYPDDCAAQGKGGCIITAIANQTSLFLDASTAPDVRKEALKYIIHFIGDLHQPLHIERFARGGNEIHVCFRHTCANNNLHSVWDKFIPHKICSLGASPPPDEEKSAAQKWANKLFSANQKRGVTPASECHDIKSPNNCSVAWATEANKLVCSYVLKPGVDWLESNDLSLEYYRGAVPIVEAQISKAGARLGGWLNAIAASAPAPQVLQKQDM